MTRVVLISTYDMGRQPFALASAAAWLRAETGARVDCLDLDIEPMRPGLMESAHLVAFYLPMHTATRLALPLLAEVQALNPSARLCCFGLYAPLNEETLRAAGARHILGNAFERELVKVVRAIEAPGREDDAGISGKTGRLVFRLPDRSDLPELSRYARLVDEPGAAKVVGYTETTRGCKHFCKHCPVVPVYNGSFEVVQREVVLEDIRQQVTRGAEHITFGDPDFFNGPSHGLAIVRELHKAHPQLSYDVTIKVEHLLRQRGKLSVLRETGCLFITTAAESFDDEVLSLLEKGHTFRDFVEALAACRAAGLTVCPTFLPFTPWTTRENYLALLNGLEALRLVDHVPPVQLALRLLITASSRLLELAAIERAIAPFDAEKLVYPWHFADPEMERLAENVMRLVHDGTAVGLSRREIFETLRREAEGPPPDGAAIPVERRDGPPLLVMAAGALEAARPEGAAFPPEMPGAPPAFVPHLSESWFC